MSATTINSAIPLEHSFYEDTRFFRLGNINQVISASSAIKLSAEQATSQFPGEILNLVSDEKKVFCSLDRSFYHNVHDDLVQIIRAIEQVPDAKIYIDGSVLKDYNASTDNHIRYVLDTLTKRKINYEIVHFNKYSGMLVNNYYIAPTHRDVGNSAKTIYEFVKPDIKDLNIKPYRKVFLSRRNQGNRQSGNPTLITAGITDNRTDNHDIVEKFFQELGYEIVIPEQQFDNFIDQINFFYTVKTLVSVTSSGLANAIFMQPGQTVVEIKTPLAIQVHQSFFTATPESQTIDGPGMLIEELHHFYEVISFKKNHLHISIPSAEKAMLPIIKRISQNEKLGSLMSDIFEV